MKMFHVTENVQGYLHAVAQESRQPVLRRVPAQAAGKKRAVLPFVTLSRQTGAGGRSLAEALIHWKGAARPNPFRDWRVFDESLCRMVAENPKLKVPLPSLLYEHYLSVMEDMAAELFGGMSSQSAVVIETFRTMRSLAASGRVILVGRGGAGVTREIPGGVHVRLVAPLAVRIRRVMALRHWGAAEAERYIKSKDRDRAALVRDYVGRDIEDPLLYDAVINTQAVCLEEAASAVAALVERRAGEESFGAVVPGGGEPVPSRS